MTARDVVLQTDRPRVTAQVVIGLMVIAAGVLFTLDNLGIVDARDYLRYWPSGLVVIGLLKLWHARRDRRGWFGGLFFLLVGAWMLVERIAYIRIDARELFPLILMFLGGYLVWRGFGRSRRPDQSGDGQSTFSSLAIMGGCAQRNNSQTFQGADLTAIMGGCEIDLRQASIPPNTEAVIDVFAFWGGIDLKVPEDWTVVSRVIPLLGGVDDKTHAPTPDAGKRLVIRGVVVMGGVAVKNRSFVDAERK